MTFLLDTHALLWANLAPGQLSRTAAQVILAPENVILVSSASAWEVATKVRLGKLPGAEIFEREFMELPRRTGFILLPVECAVALRAGRLPASHGDPFDRMIAAQALALDIPVISKDAKLDDFGVRRIW